MASPDESRADDTRDPSGIPASPTSQDAPVESQDAPVERQPAPAAEAQDRPEPGPGAVPPGRPRGAASFPGGPPPASTPAEPQATPAASVAVESPPRFQVTTVETTAAASFPGGPPPTRPAGGEPAPREAAAGDGRAAPNRRRAGSSRRRAAALLEVADASPPLLASTSTISTDPPAARVPPATAVPPATPEATAPVPPATPEGTAPVPPTTPEATAPAQAVPGAGAAEVATAPAPPPTAPAPAAPEPAPAATAPAPAAPEPAPAATAPAPAAPVPAGPQPEAADAERAEADADEDGGPLARPAGGRRRRRGRRPSQARAEARLPEAPEARLAEAREARLPEGPEGRLPEGREARLAEAREARTDQPAGEPDEAPRAAPRSTSGPGAGEPALTDAPDKLDGAIAVAASPDRGPAPAGEDAEDQEESAGGSARTRARRRRRAAAKARTRTDPPEGEAAPATDGGPGPGATADADAEAAPAGRGGGRARPGQRGAAAAAVADAAPAPAKPERPPRGRGRGRLGAVARDRAEPPAVEAAPAAAAEPAARTTPATPAAGASTRLDSRGRAGQGSRQADRGRRRRTSGLTEEQKRALREDGPDKRMLVTEGAERTQIGVLEGRTLVEHYVTRKAGRSFVGNIYLGRVQNVLPGMEAAFVDIGKGRNAVLYAGEVNYNEEDLDGEAPRIEKVLKPGQSVLVQVTKDPIGAKGARLTAQVSLAGRYLVLQPEDNTFGISRRLPEEERSRLREILKEVRPKGLGLIVRTAAEGATADDLRADLTRLQARWEAVEGKAKKASAPAVIYSEPELVVRVIRDIFSPDFIELVVDAPELYERVRDYLEEVAPDLLPKLRHHDGKLPLFEHHHVVEQIHKALERKVWLPSGGSIVIDRTEAMTVVDVNTGKFVGKSNLEETVVANNLEAADEIVRQLRLRDIGGIIIIDFIDMLFERNQQAVVERLRAALARDKTKSQVMEVSSLGLVQMTRKRVSGGLLESFSETCPTCEGRGVVITHEI